ncbi:ribosome assembly RNA-binding protein YhbY [Alkalilimnicola sp. S0819]|uniref:ribosome assembly RNA-binding protein YhbY n=1 Tax=Alkalilimnicola sp. S0819 TaxID=2613922 RepID=UPI00126228B9|nr:ribosome assembly RNA-binding protein YhbY [Alkalilimnicola sp. S0819]KAB7628418.1 ribosome assembly RNA-binding protein YhbY [Alkalilimnicola sp. S0819]MPQ15321.1 ribosome assembly RNA-binding protein YhbY [Alkalilimnicola sp. S0819]
MPLNEEQRRHLRRLGHQLKPVVRTGNAGLSEAVMNEIEIALAHHELIKVKLIAGDREEKQSFIDQILAQTEGEPVQVIGHVLLLYRPNPRKKKERIALP